MLAVELSSRSVHLTWATLAGLLITLAGAKVLGLYDRDEVLLRSTTLDEVPKLFHMATMCALVAWLAGGLVVAGRLDRSETLLLWLSLLVLLALARFAARAFSLRVTPPSAACSSATPPAPRSSAGSSTERRGVRAELVGHVELDTIDAWSRRRPPRRGSPRCASSRAAWTCTARSSRRTAAGADDMLDLLRTLNAVGVRSACCRASSRSSARRSSSTTSTA